LDADVVVKNELMKFKNNDDHENAATSAAPAFPESRGIENSTQNVNRDNMRLALRVNEI
jgi:hypothetical protein